MSYRVLLVAASAAMVGFAAQAVEWSGEVTLTGDVNEDVTITGETTVTVASGAKASVNGTITGSSNLTLTGGGTLVLTTASDNFSSPIYIDTGVLQVLTGGALGTGKITIKGGTGAISQLQFGQLDAAVTTSETIVFSNEIEILNGGDTSHCQMTFGPHGDKNRRHSVRYEGAISCAGDLYFKPDVNNQYSGSGSGMTFNFAGGVTAKKIHIYRATVSCTFSGDVNVDEIVMSSSGAIPHVFKGSNHIGAICLISIKADSADAFGGAAIDYQDKTAEVDMNAYSQTVAWLGCGNKYTGSYITSGESDVTLALTGGVQSACYYGYLTNNTSNASYKLNLTLDAGNEDFVQAFSNNVHGIRGDITIKKGTLLFGGATSLPNVPTINVEGGLFKLDTTLDDPLQSLTNVTLGMTGRIDLGVRTVWVDTLMIGAETPLYADHTTHPDQIADGTVLRVRRVPSGMSYTQVDMTTMGDWEIEVPAASTNIVTVAQTGSGKITKKGAGYLLFQTANTFTGGVQIDAGTVTVAKNGALGTGPIDIAGTTTGTCQLRIDFVAIGEPSTIVNAITLENDSKADHEALYFVYPTATTAQPASKNAPWTVTFTGGITAKGTLCIRDNRGGNQGDKTDPAKDPNVYVCAGQKWIVFDCPIDAAGEEIRFTKEYATCGDVEFKKKVTAKLFYAGGYKNYNEYGSFWFDVANDFETVDITYCSSYFGVENALGDPNYRVNELFSANYPYIYMQGHDQRVKSIYSGTKASDNGYGFYTASADASATPATLTIDGAAADGGKSSQLGFFGKMTLVVDAQDDDFVQTLRGSTPSGISGAIVVKKGRLVITASPTFKYLPEIVVEGGVFESQSEVANCFQALKRLTVKNGGVFRASSAVAFPSTLDALNLETGAQLDVPADMALSVGALTVDGMGWRKGVYTQAQIAALPEGVTLNVTADTVTEAVWTGAGADNLTTTLGNWLIGGEVPTAIDFAHWIPLVTLAGGDGLKYADGDWFKRIDSALAVSNLEGEVFGPFTIEPATEGATLKLTEGLKSEMKRQLVLSGHFINAAGDVTTGEIFYELTSAPSGAPIIKPTNSTGSSELLVLKGVTIDMPLRVMSHGNYTVFMGYAGTTNVVNGLTQITTYSSYIAVDSDGEVNFAGGLKTGNAEYFYGPGGYRVGNSGSFADGVLIQKNANFIFETEEQCCNVLGNKNREGVQFGSATVYFGRDNCMTDTVQMVASDSNAVRLEFGQTSQLLGRLAFNVATNNKSAWLNGDYPSMLELTCKIRPGAWSYPQYIKTPYCNARVTGGLSIHLNDQDGGTNVFTLAGREFESCGDLVVSAGTLELANDATWLNGTNFTAKGEGVLKFAAAGQVNPNFATIHFEDGGKIYIPEGVTLSFAEGDIGGDPITNGKYTGSEGALADRITGGGTLKVGKNGMLLVIQ